MILAFPHKHTHRESHRLSPLIKTSSQLLHYGAVSRIKKEYSYLEITS